jgi:DNA-3-methyladenine glycosylase II
MAYYCFPSPHILNEVSQDELIKMQFSKQKINYIKNISKAFCDKKMNKQELMKSSSEKQLEQLQAIKGIGPWTANYVSMKSLRNMNCIAYGDTGLSAALHKHFNTEKKPNKLIVDQVFRPFAGWESYLNFYLWRSLS